MRPRPTPIFIGPGGSPRSPGSAVYAGEKRPLGVRTEPPRGRERQGRRQDARGRGRGARRGPAVPGGAGAGTEPRSSADGRSAGRGGAAQGREGAPGPPALPVSSSLPRPQAHLRRGAEDVAASGRRLRRVWLRAPRPGRAADRAALAAAAGSLPGPAPHFLRGPRGGAGAGPSGQVGARVGARAGGAGAGREGTAARAPGTWPCSLRHGPHLAGRRSRDPLAGCPPAAPPPPRPTRWLPVCRPRVWGGSGRLGS